MDFLSSGDGPFDREYMGEREGFRVEVGPTFGSESDRFDVTVWRNNMGSGLGVSFADRGKARKVARLLYEMLKPEHEQERRLQVARHAEYSERARVQAEERRVEGERKRAEQRALVEAGEAEVVTLYACSNCGEAHERDEYEEPYYECGQDGTGGRGEDARRCEVCHKFTAKVADESCPACEIALEEEPEAVEGYVFDGEFVPRVEFEAAV